MGHTAISAFLNLEREGVKGFFGSPQTTQATQESLRASRTRKASVTALPGMSVASGAWRNWAGFVRQNGLTLSGRA
jgi:hypothetical protein